LFDNLWTGSECNSSKLTFDGVDTMGERLAEEVLCNMMIFVVSTHLNLAFILHLIFMDCDGFAMNDSVISKFLVLIHNSAGIICC